MLALFAAVAVIGTIGGSATVMMRGPLKTMSEVNQNTMTEGFIYTAGKMVLLDAETWTAGGDCDADRIIEPRPWRAPGAELAPTGGGLIPNEIGSMKRDPWGTQLGYCAWDHGSVVTDNETVIDDKGCDSHNLLAGTNKRDYPTVAVISAGPNGAFNTTCRDWAASDLDMDGTIDTGSGDALMFQPGGDDIFIVYSYAEAAQELPTIWREDSPDIWSVEIGDDGPSLVAEDDVEFSGSELLAPTRMEMVGQKGLLIPDENNLPTCNGGTEGQIRRNMGVSPPTLERCESGSFETVSGGSDTGDGLPTAGTTSGLVAYYRLDETSGTSVLDAVGSNNGSYLGGMDPANDAVDGIIGMGLEFDGVNDGVTVSDSADIFDLKENFSASVWVNLANLGSSQVILSKSHGSAPGYSWGIDLNLDTDFQFYTVNTGGTGYSAKWSGTPVIGQWYHLTGVKEGSDVRFYVNGIMVDENTGFSGTEVDGDGIFGIGYNPIPDHFGGIIDDVRIYDRALSDTEVLGVYNRTNKIVQANIAQTGTLSNTVGSAGWTTTLASDSAGDSAGVAFRIDDTIEDTDPPSAAIEAVRVATPSRANIAFKNFDGSSLNTGMIIDRDGKLAIDDNPQIAVETLLQIGEHYNGAWENNYTQGLLVTSNVYATNHLSYFGDRDTNNSSTQILYSNDLKLQHTDSTGSTINEILTFDGSSAISARGDIAIKNDNSDVGFRIERYSGSAGDQGVFTFNRSRGSNGAVNDGDIIGSVVFKGYNGAFNSGADAAIRSVVNGSISGGNVPVDLVFGTSSTAMAESVEGLRVTSDGEVGVGVVSPEAQLHVGGRLNADEGIQVGVDNTCSDVIDTGTLSYESGNFKLCDGSSQAVINASGSGPGSSLITDCSPIHFDFQDRNDLIKDTLYETNTVMIGNVTNCTLIAASQSTALTIIKNGADEPGLSVNVESGDRIALRIRSSSVAEAAVSTYVSLGDHTDEIVFQNKIRYVFVTLGSYSPQDYSGLADFDAICQSYADSPSSEVSGTFLAWMADGDPNSAPAVRFTRSTVPYVTSQGVKIADDWDDLTDGSLDSIINMRPFNDDISEASTWTNVNADGTQKSTTEHCSNWAGSSGQGRSGNTNRTNSQWTDNGSVPCNSGRHFFCFQQ